MCVWPAQSDCTSDFGKPHSIDRSVATVQVRLNTSVLPLSRIRRTLLGIRLQPVLFHRRTFSPMRPHHCRRRTSIDRRSSVRRIGRGVCLTLMTVRSITIVTMGKISFPTVQPNCNTIARNKMYRSERSGEIHRSRQLLPLLSMFERAIDPSGLSPSASLRCSNTHLSALQTRQMRWSKAMLEQM